MKNSILNKLAFLSLIISFFTTLSCSNSSDIFTDYSNPDSDKISNLKLDKSSTAINYVDLNTKKLVSSTDHWDFSMGWMYASRINANVDKGGKLNYIDKAYKEVTAEAVTEKFGSTKEDFNKNFSNINDFGIHKNGLDGNKEGWLTYDFDNNHLVTPLENRTLLLITTDHNDTNKKKLYKIRMISMYKDAPTHPTGNEPAPFLTCEFQEVHIDSNLIN